MPSKEIESEKVEANFPDRWEQEPLHESDVLMASSADAIVSSGLMSKVDGKAVKAAKAEGVQVKLYSIVYELIDQVNGVDARPPRSRSS